MYQVTPIFKYQQGTVTSISVVQPGRNYVDGVLIGIPIPLNNTTQLTSIMSEFELQEAKSEVLDSFHMLP